MPTNYDPRRKNDLLFVAFGGGTNSYASLILLHRWGVRPDYITFSDTGGEKPHTYKAIEVINEWLRARQWPEVLTLREGGKWGSLEAQCVGLGTLPSLAFGMKSCSQRYKITPQTVFVNNDELCKSAIARGGRIIKVIGYDAGERRRTFTAPPDDDTRFWYPLLDNDIDREECLRMIDAEKLPRPGKSACFFCPAMRKPEVIQLSIRNPDLFARALVMEDTARASGKLGVVKGLGRHWTWRELVAERERLKALGLEPPIEKDDDSSDDMPCGCYDG